MGLQKEQCAREKEGTSAVLLQSGLDNEWWVDSMECCCYLRNIQDLLSDGKTPHRKVVWNTLLRTSDTVWSNGRTITLSLRRAYRDYLSSVQKSCQVFFLGIRNARQKAQRMTFFHIPSRRWNSQNPWRRSTSEAIHINQGASGTRRLNKKFFDENQSESLLQLLFKMTQHGMMRKLKMISGVLREIFHLSPSSGTQSQTVRAERRIISYSVEVHRRDQNNMYITGRFVGQIFLRLLERGWWKNIVRCMDRLHNINFLERKATCQI